MDWIDALNDTLRYVEAHLEDGSTAEDVARHTGYSSFYLQRIFATLTEMTLGGYLRARRLSEAALRLQRGEPVLETALRYGWDSPESFARAFRKFHGCAPSAVQRGSCRARCLTPLHLRICMTGGNVMNYVIEERPAQRVIGMERRFRNEDSFATVPEFWSDYSARGLHEVSPGVLGICIDDDAAGESFAYLIGRFAGEDEGLPEGFVCRTIPARTWANFECRGPMPDAIQQLNRRIFADWLISNGEWELAESMSIEWYDDGDMSAADYRSGIMIPVKRREK